MHICSPICCAHTRIFAFTIHVKSKLSTVYAFLTSVWQSRFLLSILCPCFFDPVISCLFQKQKLPPKRKFCGCPLGAAPEHRAKRKAREPFHINGLRAVQVCNIKTISMPLFSGLSQKPNRSPVQRVRFGKEAQRHERTLTYKISRSKR